MLLHPCKGYIAFIALSQVRGRVSRARGVIIKEFILFSIHDAVTTVLIVFIKHLPQVCGELQCTGVLYCTATPFEVGNNNSHYYHLLPLLFSSGESGAGKTETCKYVIRHLTELSTGDRGLETRIMQVYINLFAKPVL